MAKNVIIPAPYNTWLTLEEAKERMGFKHSQYVRQLVLAGKLGTYPDTVVKLDMGGYEKWFVSPEACDHYTANVGQSGGFGAGNIRRFVLRFNTDHVSIEQMTTILEGALGPNNADEGTDDWIYQFVKASAGQKKSKPKDAEPPEDFTARIVANLTQAIGDRDDEGEGADTSDLEDEDTIDDVLA